VQPDLTKIQPLVKEANRRFAGLPLNAQGLAIAAIAQSYLRNSPPATFRVIVNPMVTWLWIGALIALSGALVGLWPSAEARRRKVTSAYAARLGRELSRA
jgi:cytochrome c-type biogenesis protein CcmF